MIYEYKCRFGHGSYDVVKSHDKAHWEERCPTCKARMVKVYSSPRVRAFQDEFYHAFGKRIGSSKQLKDEIRRVNSETGKELVEVGNSSVKKKSERKRVNHQTLKEAYKELRGALRHG